MKHVTLCAALLASLAIAGAGVVGADSVVGTLTAGGGVTTLKSACISIQADPGDTGDTWLVILVSDVPVTPADRSPKRLAALANAGKLKAVRVLWKVGFDAVFATPYHQGLALSGRRAPERPTISLERFDDERFQGEILSKPDWGWSFEARVEGALKREGVVELEPGAVEVAPGGTKPIPGR